MKNYGIKENYINNPKIEYDNTKHYWTKKRIEASKHFQFHVYSELNEIIDFSKIFFDEIFKRVIVFKKILYNQIVIMRIGQ